jgi:hypothetical protein
MSLRKKKKVVEEEVVVEEPVVAEEVEEEAEVLEEGGDIDAIDDINVEEVEAEEVENLEEAPVESDIHIGNKVTIKVPRDYDGRPITPDMFALYTVYAIDGDKVQLRKQSGGILFVNINNIKKIN